MNTLIASMIMQSGRSWWEARYADGRVIAEWDTLPGLHLPTGSGKLSRWEGVPKKGMVGLRILCPNGMCGELEAPEGYRFLQLKAGGFAVGQGQYCDAHIIGVVTDKEGACFCRAWEVKEQRLVEFTDNVHHFRYRKIGPLSLEVQGLRV